MEDVQGRATWLGAAEQQNTEHPRSVSAITRVALIDSDSGFVRVLAKRIGAIGWRAELLGAPPPPEDLLGMRLQAIVIDAALLGDDAWRYLEEICGHRAPPATIVCTGPTSVAQRVRGLRLGVDDWMTKPCHPEEVLARIESALRRRHGAMSSTSSETLVAGELEIRRDMFEGFVGGRPIGLTRREFELLHLLANHRGKVVPREEIYQRVWGYAMVHGDRSADVFVRRVRKKLESASPSWRYLHTHFGVGYRFEPEETSGSEASEGPESPDSSATLPPA
jgi:DNA-binding response OmpR family regulator